jgi:Histidine kinase-like ATPase domain
VSDDQLLPWQTDLLRPLVEGGQAVIACACSDAIDRPEGAEGTLAGATPIDVNGHPAGVRYTGLAAEVDGADARRHTLWHRCPVDVAPAPGRTYPATAEAVAAARRQVRREAQDAGASSEAIAAIGLAVSEASTNAVLHAYAADGTRGATFSISTASQGNIFSVWVLDEGHGGISNVPSPGLGAGLGHGPFL